MQGLIRGKAEGCVSSSSTTTRQTVHAKLPFVPRSASATSSPSHRQRTACLRRDFPVANQLVPVPRLSMPLWTDGASTRPSTSRSMGSSSSRSLSCSSTFTEASTYYSKVLAPVKVVEQLKEQEELKPMPREVEGLVDDPSVHNPLQRMERLGTGWFGVIMEHDGVLFQDTWELHMQAWLRVAQELGHARPLGHLFRRVKGLRDDVVVTTVFNWTQNPSVAKMIAARKGEVYEELLGGRQPPAMLEARPFLETIRRYNIPVGLASALPDKRVRDGLAKFGLQQYFDTVVTADDGGATEFEWYLMYAAQQIQRPPMRCIVIGESNTSVEAAHELGMKCVVLSGNTPVYNFSSADLVVRDLSQLTFLNLKKLFGQEGLVEPRLTQEDSSMESTYNSDNSSSSWLSDLGDDDYDDLSDDGASFPRGAAMFR